MKKRYILLGIVIIITVLFVFGAFNTVKTDEKNRTLAVDENNNPLITAKLEGKWYANGVHCLKQDSPYVNIIKLYNLSNETEAESFHALTSGMNPDGNYHGNNYYHIYSNTQFKEYHGVNPFKDVKVENTDYYICYKEAKGYGIVTLADSGYTASDTMNKINT